MAKDLPERGGAPGTTVKQLSRGLLAMARDGDGHRARNGNGHADERASNGWLDSVVCGSVEAKTPVNIRLDADVVRYFRAGGPGYQTRINEVLKAFVTARIRAGDPPGTAPKPKGNGRRRTR